MPETNSRPQQRRPAKTLNREAILVSHGLIGLLFALEIVLGSMSMLSKSFLALIVLAIWGLGITRIVNIRNINERPIIYLASYHVLVGLALVMFAEPGNVYIFVWLMLVYRAELIFSRKGAFVSLLVLGMVLEGSIARQLYGGAEIMPTIKMAAIQYLVIFAISLFFIDTSDLTVHEKQQLEISADRAELEGQRLLSLINSMADGVIALDSNGIIKLYNAASMNILDTNVDLKDRPIYSAMSVIDQNRATIDILDLITTKKIAAIYTDYFLVYQNGEKINLFMSVSPIKIGFSHESESGYIIALRDITREKSLEEERNEFISVVSHELRTPIAITEANISNAQFIVEQGKDTGAVKNALEAAHRQSLYLANMINDLSTLSRAERGKLDMVAEDISPIEIVHSLYDDYKRDATEKKLELKVEIADGVPEKIRSNRLYVREIMQNFVTNSIKYTKEGWVLIRVAPHEGGVEFSVKDSGIGISKADQKRVFDKFFRSEDFRTRESSGTGLGLYITQKLIKIIGAQVSVKSQLNVGSTFAVFVPSIEASADSALKEADDSSHKK